MLARCGRWRDFVVALAGAVVAAAVLVPVGWVQVRGERRRADAAEETTRAERQRADAAEGTLRSLHDALEGKSAEIMREMRAIEAQVQANEAMSLDALKAFEETKRLGTPATGAPAPRP